MTPDARSFITLLIIYGLQVHIIYKYYHSISGRIRMMERVPLDPLLRGLCEQQIDGKLFGDDIKHINDFVNTLDLSSSSKEDIALGLFLGTVYNELKAQCMNVYNRPPGKGEICDYHLILKRRAYEVKEKIRELNTIIRMEAVEDTTSKPSDEPEDDVHVVRELEDQVTSNLRSLYDLEEASRVEGETLPEIEIDFNARSSKKRRRTILGIPILAR